MFNLLISRSVFFDVDYSIRPEMFDLVNLIKGKEIQIYIVSRTKEKYKEILVENNLENIKFGNRGKLSRKIIEDNKNFMFLGSVDQDIYIAANNKLLLINPTWIDVEENIDKYGFKLNSVGQVVKCIDILRLETELFYDFSVNEKTRLIAVSNANKFFAVKNENEMIQRYMKTLKFGSNTYQYAVYFHYLTIITGMDEFKDVDYWMSVPSSSGKNDNFVYDLVKQTRYLLNNRRSQELFIRHTPAKKSTSIDKLERIRQGCTRHLDTIQLNPKYKGKLKNSKICVLDDYVTNGASFECVRNLLINEGVSEIILIAIGSFRSLYQKEDVTINGNVYKPGFQYSINSRELIRGKANEKSSEVVNEIYEIIKG
ncbi:hypothetical protein [Alkalihalobacillus sp. AL-G]|uniref:hypothetical protein n=1 Tax=Alkalihalobacillus sp. AL-G TaxID=2926399 RepID=UPI00272C819A|nr:hypothetical protein [Alkalihalobacillus sp. AL-G]WLD93359.1 hypothetical protein MOJ78_20600 [Alkalihalobacillus sp. AL-G]